MESYSLIDKESLERYTCAICLEIFSNPYLITHCLHIYCQDCINQLINYFNAKTGKLECPICRASFKKEDLIQDPSVLSHIDNIIIKCECKKNVKLVNYNLHTRSNCTDYYEMENIEIENFMKKNSLNKINLLSCPICLAPGFDQNMIVSHLINTHPADEAICPICALANKNDVQEMIGFHMLEVHKDLHISQNGDDKFQIFNEYLLGIPLNPSENEDDQIKRAIEESLIKK